MMMMGTPELVGLNTVPSQPAMPRAFMMMNYDGDDDGQRAQ